MTGVQTCALPISSGSVSHERRSFFSLWHTVQATEDASMSLWVQASSACMRLLCSFTSKAHVARSVARTGLTLRLSLKSGFKLDWSWVLSWSQVRAQVGAKVVSVAFRFSISIFQSMKMQFPWDEERMVSRMLWDQFLLSTSCESSRRYVSRVRPSIQV